MSAWRLAKLAWARSWMLHGPERTGRRSGARFMSSLHNVNKGSRVEGACWVSGCGSHLHYFTTTPSVLWQNNHRFLVPVTQAGRLRTLSRRTETVGDDEPASIFLQPAPFPSPAAPDGPRSAPTPRILCPIRDASLGPDLKEPNTLPITPVQMRVAKIAPPRTPIPDVTRTMPKAQKHKRVGIRDRGPLY